MPTTHSTSTANLASGIYLSTTAETYVQLMIKKNYELLFINTNNHNFIHLNTFTHLNVLKKSKELKPYASILTLNHINGEIQSSKQLQRAQLCFTGLKNNVNPEC